MADAPPLPTPPPPAPRPRAAPPPAAGGGFWAGIPTPVAVIFAPLWVPVWAVLNVLLFVLGVCRYLVVDRFLRPILGERWVATRGLGGYVLLLLLSVVLAPVVLAWLIVRGVFQTLWAFLCLLGRWQVGVPHPLAALDRPGSPPAPGAVRWGRRIAAFLVGLLWLAVLAVSVYSLVDPAGLYESLTRYDPRDGMIRLGEQGWYFDWLRADRLSPSPWWLLSITGPFTEARTDFQSGFALVALLLLVRWPGLFAGVLGWPILRWAQWGLRIALVLAVLAVSLFSTGDLGGLLAPETAQRLAAWVGAAGPHLLLNALLIYAVKVLVALAGVGLLFGLGYHLARARARLRQYVPYLAWRLLERKLIAFFAVGAIALCTAMVLTVYSIMGGFLDQILNRSHNMLGDLVLDASSDTGFYGYEGFLSELRRDVRIEDASPVIYTKGLARFESGRRVKAVNVVGIDPASKQNVTQFSDGLRFQKGAKVAEFDPARLPHAPLDLIQDNPPIGAILGRDTLFTRNEKGQYNFHVYPRFSEFVLSLVPISRSGTIGEPLNVRSMFVDDHLTGVYDIDSQQVYVELPVLQKLLKMDAGEADPETGTPGRQARISQIQVRLTRDDPARPPSDAYVQHMRQEVQDAWDRYIERYVRERPWLGAPYVEVSTWDQVNAGLINAVRKEKFMITTLFGGISLVSVLLVFILLYLIAMDKTRDIGVIKAVGGSNAGAAAIFVAYGAVIGLVGALLGLGLGTLVTRNINEIQDFIAALHPALRVWDPSVYVFERIPSVVKGEDALTIFVVAVLSATLGAVVPALKAANMQPVESLRFE